MVLFYTHSRLVSNGSRMGERTCLRVFRFRLEFYIRITIHYKDFSTSAINFESRLVLKIIYRLFRIFIYKYLNKLYWSRTREKMGIRAYYHPRLMRPKVLHVRIVFHHATDILFKITP